jgi:hypothetical protein
MGFLTVIVRILLSIEAVARCCNFANLFLTIDVKKENMNKQTVSVQA